jgi:RNA polymerase sigma-70 factor (ECF subfamily)
MPNELADERDKRLVRRFQSGDLEALKELLTLHEASVTRYIKSKTHRQDVDDRRQEVWVRVMNRAASFDTEAKGRFDTWLIGIAWNVVREARVHRFPGDLETPEDVSDLQDAVPEQAEHEQRQRAIKRAVASLPDDQRQAVLLHYFGGKSMDEVAEAAATTKNNIKYRLKAALKQLPAFFRKEVG